MSSIDIAALLEEISEDQPCGEDLEYDPAFIELEIAARGKDEQEFGETVIEAEEPDWADVKAKALAVLGQSKDLRAALHLARAALKTDGLVGFSDVLALVRGYVERYWESVHPRLDPDDDNDPTMRMNTLGALADEDTILRAIRKTPLTDSRVIGRFGLRDIAIAVGELPAPEGAETAPPDMSTIEAAFKDTAEDTLRATAEAAHQAIEHLRRIDARLDEVIAAGMAADLSDLTKVLREVAKVMDAHIGAAGAGGADAAESDDAGLAGGAAPGTVPGPAGVAAGPVSGAINNTNDVVRTLDMICDYYARCEPSSPLPLLLRRARRLVSKDFMSILKDIAPEGVSQAELVGGVRGDEFSDD